MTYPPIITQCCFCIVLGGDVRPAATTVTDIPVCKSHTPAALRILWGSDFMETINSAVEETRG